MATRKKHCEEILKMKISATKNILKNVTEIKKNGDDIGTA